MQNSQVVQLLKTLSSAEKKSFLRFLQSSWRGGKPEHQRLAEYLLLSGTGSLREKKMAFSHVFGADTAYDDARLRKVMEQLLRMLEHFLVLEQRETEAFDFRLRLASLLAERKQDRLWRRVTDAPLPFPEHEADWTAEVFEQAARWFRHRYDRHSAARREHDAALYARVTRYETIGLVARRLRNACIFLSNSKEKGSLPTDPLLEWAETKASEYADLPLLNTLFAGLRALQNPDDPAHFISFRDGLLTQHNCFTTSERRDLLLVAINFCSKRYNDGDPAWLDSQLDLYEYGLREGLLLENNWVTGYTFTNIATLALIGRRYERLAQLLRDYRDKITPRDRAGAAAFNEARLYHALRQYRPALALLQQNVFDDLLLNLSAKTVQAKCFYELEEYDLLDTHLEALRKFIRRHKEVGYYGERYLNFVAILRRLARMAPAARENLRQEIADMQVLAEKAWLLERL
ncbi:MAG: hypothetical protein JNL02_06750 [Saprospiraceae bacterium]|nr:hypothetical protein [Saprospiraceae bacterium]